MEVFAADSATRTPVWWRGDGASWSTGPSLPGGANLPAVPVTAVATSPDSIDVFAGGPGNTPWWWHWNGTQWSPPTPLPVGANIPAERIAALAAPGRLDVFAPGAGNHLWHWLKVGALAWRAPVDLGGNLPTEGVSAVSWGPNRIDVFAASRDPGNPLQHWWSDGGGFSGPETLGGSLASGTVSAVSHAANRLDVFGVSLDGRIAHWLWNGQSWTGPDFHADGLPAGDLSAVVRKPHRLAVFLAGAGNTLLQWPGGGLENATSQPWRNWPTNHERNPVVGHLWPDSREELASIVREAERLGRGVRAVGSGWSNSDVAVSPGYVVETDKLRNVISHVLGTALNTTGSGLRSRLVHVEAGMKLHELNTYLDGKGLAVRTMGGSSGQSVAGLVSTSAHGMDVDRPPIPDMVRAIHLVGPGGVEHWIEPSAGITTRDGIKDALGLADESIHYDDEWFDAALVSAGSLGIIYSLVVEAVPQYDLVEAREVLDWSAMKARLRGTPPSPFDGNRSVQIVVEPYPRGDGSRNCYLTTRTEAPPTAALPDLSLEGSVRQAVFTPALLTLLSLDRGLVDDTVWNLTKEAQPVPPPRPRGWGHTVMGAPDPGPIRALAVEVVFDADDGSYLEFVDAALQLLYDAYYVERPSLGYLGYLSLRYQQGSRAYLSPHHGHRRTCTVECAAVWRVPAYAGAWPDTPTLLARLEAAGRRYGGIQHWGMNDALDALDVGRAYPRADAWRRVRWELTKGGTITTFDSDFTRRCGLSSPPFLVGLADFDRDGKTDLAYWRPGDGTWHVIGSKGRTRRTQQWGAPGDVPVPGDYDGDGKTDLAVWRPSNGTWYVIDSRSGKKRTKQWGEPGDVPVPGDYDGDGRTEFAVWRPSNVTWYVIGSKGGKTRAQKLGKPGDIPVPGDYDGDGKTELAVWRPRTGTWVVLTAGGRKRTRKWGASGDVPVPGDYDGDGKTDLAYWRPSDGTWNVINSKGGKTRTQKLGLPGDIPVPGDYDGDGRSEFAVWRPSNGTWYVMDSKGGKTRSRKWGRFGDIPV
ncbi:MAG TPA: FG-GAP-like repeat-containing protein [Gaiellaceae bacterium]|nr:FG-GAP-like repeat-containing protein [Gaiellaceae bacterium]